jgi:HTH-type transcriptional regulator/antitoxin HigA
MIKNQKQRRVTQEQIKLLSSALTQARAVAKPDVFMRAHITSLETDIHALQEELRHYQSLLEGKFDLAALQEVEHLGQDLIRARICCKLTQKDLATALGKKAQAIQRLEAADYSSASLATLRTIASTIISCRKRAA